MDVTVYQGKCFEDEASLEEWIDAYQVETKYAFSVKTSASLNKVILAGIPCNEKLGYDEICFACVRRGIFQTKGNKLRKSNTIKTNCPAFIQLRTSKDKKKTLDIYSFNKEHNHDPETDEFLHKHTKQVQKNRERQKALRRTRLEEKQGILEGGRQDSETQRNRETTDEGSCSSISSGQVECNPTSPASSSFSEGTSEMIRADISQMMIEPRSDQVQEDVTSEIPAEWESFDISVITPRTLEGIQYKVVGEVLCKDVGGITETGSPKEEAHTNQSAQPCQSPLIDKNKNSYEQPATSNDNLSLQGMKEQQAITQISDKIATALFSSTETTPTSSSPLEDVPELPITSSISQDIIASPTTGLTLSTRESQCIASPSSSGKIEEPVLHATLSAMPLNSLQKMPVSLPTLIGSQEMSSTSTTPQKTSPSLSEPLSRSTEPIRKNIQIETLTTSPGALADSVEGKEVLPSPAIIPQDMMKLPMATETGTPEEIPEPQPDSKSLETSSNFLKDLSPTSSINKPREKEFINTIKEQARELETFELARKIISLSSSSKVSPLLPQANLLQSKQVMKKEEKIIVETEAEPTTSSGTSVASKTITRTLSTNKSTTRKKEAPTTPEHLKELKKSSRDVNLKSVKFDENKRSRGRPSEGPKTAMGKSKELKPMVFAKKPRHMKLAQILQGIITEDIIPNVLDKGYRIERDYIDVLTPLTLNDPIVSASVRLKNFSEYFEEDAFEALKRMIAKKQAKGPWFCRRCNQKLHCNSIECECCLQWIDWHCEGLKKAPPQSKPWFCSKCTKKSKCLDSL